MPERQEKTRALYAPPAFVSEGILTDSSGVTSTPGGAASGAGGPGGLPEVVIPNPAQQVQLTNVSGVNPPY